MQFNNRRFGIAAQPFKVNPYTGSEEQFTGSPVPPPAPCFVAIQVGGGGRVITQVGSGGFVLVDCPVATEGVIDIFDNKVITINDERVVAEIE